MMGISSWWLTHPFRLDVMQLALIRVYIADA